MVLWIAMPPAWKWYCTFTWSISFGKLEGSISWLNRRDCLLAIGSTPRWCQCGKIHMPPLVASTSSNAIQIPAARPSDTFQYGASWCQGMCMPEPGGLQMRCDDQSTILGPICISIMSKTFGWVASSHAHGSWWCAEMISSVLRTG